MPVVVQSSMQLQQKETGTNIYTFNSGCLTFTIMAGTTELNYN